jgi:cyclopropane fatty-acyl-phospholipid synthase-like methyltransferase
MDKYEITFKTWNKVADMYQEKFMDLDLYDDTYDLFLEHLVTDARILEVACGPGNITKYLLSKRPDLNILATDISPNMLELAQKNCPSAEFQILDCRQIIELNQKFDAVLNGFSFPYLSKEDCANFMKDAYDLLNPNGLIYVSAIEGDYSKSGFEAGKTGDQCYVYYHEKETLMLQMAENNFEIVREFEKTYPKGDDTDTHLIIIGRKIS